MSSVLYSPSRPDTLASFFVFSPFPSSASSRPRAVELFLFFPGCRVTFLSLLSVSAEAPLLVCSLLLAFCRPSLRVGSPPGVRAFACYDFSLLLQASPPFFWRSLPCLHALRIQVLCFQSLAPALTHSFPCIETYFWTVPLTLFLGAGPGAHLGTRAGSWG